VSASPEITRQAAALLERAAAARWRGSDPYDGLWWKWPAALTRGRRRRQAILQLHARSPVDIRRLRRGDGPPIAKALGLFGSTALRLRRVTGEERFDALARDALAQLDADRGAGDEAWGYPWDTQTRWSYYRAGSPNIVATVFATRALAEAGRELGESRFDARAQTAARWTLEELYLSERGFFAYHPGSDVLIHNANLLGAQIVHGVLGDGSGRRQVEAAVERTLAAQDADGSWPYGERIAFVDSFHTGYVLHCLCELRDVDPAVDDAVVRGTEYYVDRFFGPAGETRLRPDRDYPIDGHAAGTALTTLAALVRGGHADRELLEKVAEFTAGRMVRDGHAVFRRYRLGRATVRYIRWCDAHVALGLADAAEALQNSSVSAASG
jgi:hypothetical protein